LSIIDIAESCEQIPSLRHRCVQALRSKWVRSVPERNLWVEQFGNEILPIVDAVSEMPRKFARGHSVHQVKMTIVVSSSNLIVFFVAVTVLSSTCVKKCRKI
jgi:hypothetical protein